MERAHAAIAVLVVLLLYCIYFYYIAPKGVYLYTTKVTPNGVDYNDGYNYNDSLAVAEKMEAILATKSQLIKAYANGLDIYTFAWGINNLIFLAIPALFIVTEKSSGTCGSAAGVTINTSADKTKKYSIFLYNFKPSTQSAPNARIFISI